MIEERHPDILRAAPTMSNVADCSEMTHAGCPYPYQRCPLRINVRAILPVGPRKKIDAL
jgi:hypothetical protein